MHMALLGAGAGVARMGSGSGEVRDGAGAGWGAGADEATDAHGTALVHVQDDEANELLMCRAGVVRSRC